VKYTTECTKVQSAVQAQAAENLKAMKAEYGLSDDILTSIQGAPARNEE
jgi:hypothetical protein